MFKIIIKIIRIINLYFYKATVRAGKTIAFPQNEVTVFQKQESFNSLTSFFHCSNKARAPEKIIEEYGKRILRLNRMESGKTVCFSTDEVELTITVIFNDYIVPSNMSLIGACGIDIYFVDHGKYQWKTTIFPNSQTCMYIKKTIYFQKGEKEIIFYLPSYASLKLLNLTIRKGYSLYKHNCQFTEGEISIYGSSISQGCASSRPGLSYSNILGRFLHMDVKNFGYSESALGQPHLIKYIAKQHSDIFILEYDHNASVSQLKSTHLQVYLNIRKENPNSIIVLMSRFSGGLSISLEEEKERNEIIFETYQIGIKNGDKKLIFIRGNEIASDKEKYFTDDRHPNDFGMYLLATTIYNRITEQRKFYHD